MNFAELLKIGGILDNDHFLLRKNAEEGKDLIQSDPLIRSISLDVLIQEQHGREGLVGDFKLYIKQI